MPIGKSLPAILFCFLFSFAAASDVWTVRADGVGSVEIGMSLSELNGILHESFSMPSEQSAQGCFYVNAKKHPGLSFMIENGSLARIDVRNRGVATSKGIKVGDSEARVSEVYGAGLIIDPHKYTNGHYLTLRSSDGKFGIRFETENGKVTMFYGGRYDAIQYVEGCG
jgi:hypothetical protein